MVLCIARKSQIFILWPWEAQRRAMMDEQYVQYLTENKKKIGDINELNQLIKNT